MRCGKELQVLGVARWDADGTIRQWLCPLQQLVAYDVAQAYTHLLGRPAKDGEILSLYTRFRDQLITQRTKLQPLGIACVSTSAILAERIKHEEHASKWDRDSRYRLFMLARILRITHWRPYTIHWSVRVCKVVWLPSPQCNDDRLVVEYSAHLDNLMQPAMVLDNLTLYSRGLQRVLGILWFENLDEVEEQIWRIETAMKAENPIELYRLVSAFVIPSTHPEDAADGSNDALRVSRRLFAIPHTHVTPAFRRTELSQE